METNQNLYNQRLNRLITTTNHQEPDRVPIINFAETYCISYANSSVEDCLKDPQKEFEVYAQLHKDVYMDATFGMCINRAMNVFQVLENNAYFISEDGTTIQHQEVAPMLETEYPAFAKDPISFGRNVIFPRKYAPLNQAYPKNLEALKSAALAFADYAKKMGDASEYAKETLGLPTLAGTPIFAPVDFIMDYLRGFRGIQLDMRRRPEELAEAAEALVPIMIQVASMGKPRLDPFP
ncbi:MAG TPA: hypothetical protein DHN33_01400, partial [Eubacteriaceae bacterium]|nr:hypothetical protein [Eubacteriaceae bacterium]